MILDSSFAVVAADTSRAMEDGMGAVVLLAHLDGRSDVMGPQRALRDLQPQTMEHDRVVVPDLTFLLDAQDLGQIDTRNGHEGCSLLFGLHRELFIVGR